MTRVSRLPILSWPGNTSDVCFARQFNPYGVARDILYNTNVVTSIVKLIVHGPMGKLV